LCGITLLSITVFKNIPMIKKFKTIGLLGLAMMANQWVFSQNDAFKTPNIKDEMTVDSDQNKKWRTGQYKYSAKPKNMWELGIHAGHFMVDGDVDPKQPAGFGVGLHLRKAVNYIFSLRLDAMYGKAKGLDPQPSDPAVIRLDNPTAANIITGNRYFRNYQITYMYGSVQMIANIGNLLFHKERNKWNAYAFIGLGLNNNKTMLDLLDGSGKPYDFSSVNTADVDTKAGRKRIKKDVKAILDGNYETEAYKKVAIFRFSDKTNIHPEFQGGIGVSRKFGKRFNLGLEHQVSIADNDLLDGHRYRTVEDQSNDTDIAHYTNLRFAFNIGNFDKKTEPLYWLNPIDAAMNDIAELKQRPKFDLTDTDGDGVIDMLDQEKATEKGAPVDTKGVALDSDKDGLQDYKDDEPYSPPGFRIDEKGVAVIPKNLTEPEVNKIIDDKLNAKGGVGMSNISGDWWLPMIHFDLDKFYVKPEFYGQLHHVATVMKKYPNTNIVVTGNTDVRLPSNYNRILSWERANAAVEYLMSKYSFPRERFIIQYAGEESPLIPGLADTHAIPKNKEMQQYLNRRVEFRVANSGDSEMARPDGKAGSNTPQSSRGGNKYSGNPNSGY
jgi:outer membrane protein OmpA-like peptidoglycan-associated protein